MNTKFDFFEEHQLHSNLWSEKNSMRYLHIPVNASCWGKTIFSKAGFLHDNACEIPKSDTVIVFLRDPIDRWLSGMATWLTYRLPHHTPLTYIRENSALLDVLYDTVRQDDHTERQTFFLQKLNIEKIQFWYITSDFSKIMTQWFRTQLDVDISGCIPEHVSTLESGKLIPKQYFKSVLEKSPQYLSRVKDFFSCDYDMIKSVKFQNIKSPKMLYYD